ncbi:hypothetical protein B7494_g6730 [Chlorociboria aeruginascens]|nr:hypothetical protein B7494_g6730 [Chlorociboria aeruginascens]
MHSLKAILTLLGLAVSTIAVPVPAAAPGSNSLNILEVRGVEAEGRSPGETIPETIKVSDVTATTGQQLDKKQICLGYNYGYGQCDAASEEEGDSAGVEDSAGEDSAGEEDSTVEEGSVARMLAA